MEMSDYLQPEIALFACEDFPVSMKYYVGKFFLIHGKGKSFTWPWGNLIFFFLNSRVPSFIYNKKLIYLGITLFLYTRETSSVRKSLTKTSPNEHNSYICYIRSYVTLQLKNAVKLNLIGKRKRKKYSR